MFEETYNTFQTRNGANLFTAIPNSDRSQLCAVIHSVPNSVEGPKLRSLVKEARKVVYPEPVLFLDFFSASPGSSCIGLIFFLVVSVSGDQWFVIVSEVL